MACPPTTAESPPPLLSFLPTFVQDFFTCFVVFASARLLFQLPYLRDAYNKLTPVVRIDLLSRFPSTFNALRLTLVPAMWGMIFCDWGNLVGWKWNYDLREYTSIQTDERIHRKYEAQGNIMNIDEDVMVGHKTRKSNELLDTLSRTVFSDDYVRSRLLTWMCAYVAFDLFVVFAQVALGRNPKVAVATNGDSSDGESITSNGTASSSASENRNHGISMMVNRRGVKYFLKKFDLSYYNISMILHHLVIFTAIPLGIKYGFGTRYMAALFVNEISTPLLNLRWTLLTLGIRKSGATRDKTNCLLPLSDKSYTRMQSLLRTTEYAFFQTFIWFRLVFNTFVLSHLTLLVARHMFTVVNHPLAVSRNIPTWVMIANVMFGYLHGLVNLYWGILILQKVLRVDKGKSKNKEAHDVEISSQTAKPSYADMVKKASEQINDKTIEMKSKAEKLAAQSESFSVDLFTGRSNDNVKEPLDKETEELTSDAKSSAVKHTGGNSKKNVTEAKRRTKVGGGSDDLYKTKLMDGSEDPFLATAMEE